MKTLTLNTPEGMRNFIEPVWQLLVKAYQHVKGGLLYRCPADLLNDTHRWRLVLHHGRVIAVTIYKSKRGWKLVAMATCREDKVCSKSRQALRRLICADLPRCWMELSEHAERFVLGVCGGHRFLVHASLAAELLNKPVLPASSDGYHYLRNIAGIIKQKVIVGTPSIILA